MPTYVFKHPTTEDRHEVVRSMKDAAQPYVVDGTTWERDYPAEANGLGRQPVPGADWLHPIYSDAMGVAVSQLPEVRRMFPQRTFLDDGRMVFRNARERTGALKEIEFRDKASY